MHPSIPQAAQAMAEQYTVDYPHAHVGILCTADGQWQVWANTYEALQAWYQSHGRYATMWSHPPMVQ